MQELFFPIPYLDSIVGLQGFGMSIASLTNAVLNVVFGLDSKGASNCRSCEWGSNWCSRKRGSNWRSCKRGSKCCGCKRGGNWCSYKTGICADSIRLGKGTGQSSCDDYLKMKLLIVGMYIVAQRDVSRLESVGMKFVQS